MTGETSEIGQNGETAETSQTSETGVTDGQTEIGKDRHKPRVDSATTKELCHRYRKTCTSMMKQRAHK